MFNTAISVAGASVISMLALTATYFSWRQSSRQLALYGGGLFIGSFFVWSAALGAEYGVVSAAIVPGLLVWFLLPLERKLLPQTPLKTQAKSLDVGLLSYSKNTGQLLVVLVLNMAAVSLVLCFAVYYLPIAVADRLALGILVLPMVWGTWSYLFLASSKPWIHTLAMVICIALGVGLMV